VTEQQSPGEPIEAPRDSAGQPVAAAPYEIPLGRPPGIDPDVAQHIETVDELGLFLMLNDMAATMSTMAFDLRNPANHANVANLQSIAEDSMTLQRVISYATRLTRRFGVEPFGDSAPKASDEFFWWVNWWNDYVTSMDEQWWANLRARIEAGESTADVRPVGTWRQGIQDGVVPAKSLVEKIEIPESGVLDIKMPTTDLEEKFGRLVRFATSPAQLWSWKNMEDGSEGYCVVRGNKPIASIKIKEPTT